MNHHTTAALVMLIIAVSAAGSRTPAMAQDTWDDARPDAHAPIGVPYGHLL